MTAEEEVAAANSAGRSGIGFGRKNVLQLTYLRTWACPCYTFFMTFGDIGLGDCGRCWDVTLTVGERVWAGPS